MSKKVTYRDLEIVVKKELNFAYGIIEGYIKDSGVKDESFVYNGETVKKAKLYITLTNKEDLICERLNIPKESLMLSEAKNGEDIKVTIPIVLYNYSAENALKVLKPGQRALFTGEHTTPTRKDGTKMFEFKAMVPAKITYFPKTEGNTPEQPEEVSHVETTEAPVAPVETKSEPLVNVGDEDLPF